MKRLKRLTVLFCVFVLLTGFTPNESFDLTSSSKNSLNSKDFPETVIINNEIKNVRIVTEEEYNLDTSDDYLIILDYGDTLTYQEDSVLLTTNVETNGLLKEIVVFVGNHVAGKIVDKGFVYLVNSPITQAIAIKAATAVAAAIPYVALFAIGATYVLTTYYVISEMVTYKGAYNSSGCFFNGTYPRGTWVCPNRFANNNLGEQQ